MWQQGYTFGMGRKLGRGTRAVLIATGCVFVLQVLVDPLTLNPPHGYVPILDRIFGLSWHGLCRGFLWQPATYLFLHAGFGHLIMNMLGLYFFGSELESKMGTKLFLYFYIACGIIAGTGWMIISGSPEVTCIGASGAVFGVVGAFAAMFPRRQIMLLFPPVAMSATVLALIFGGISLVQLVGGSGRIAHAAHLAGGIAGYAYGLRLRGVWRNVFSDMSAKKRRKRFIVFENDAEDLSVDSAEVDEILEKIKKTGIRSLTRKERHLLEHASGK